LPGERHQAIQPVRAAFPSVAISTEPAVARSDNLFVTLIEVASQSVALPLELRAYPTARLNGAEGKFVKRLGLKRGAVGDDLWRGRLGRERMGEDYADKTAPGSQQGHGGKFEHACQRQAISMRPNS
jgi:hypothetical protein